MVVGLNACEKPVADLDARAAWFPMDDLPKGPANRAMWQAFPFTDDDLVLWADDDTWLESGAWLPAIVESFTPFLYAGYEIWHNLVPNEAEYVRARPWYRGVTFEVDPKTERPRVMYQSGGFVACGGAWLNATDWPDETLRHNGDDILQGHAARQVGANAVSMRDPRRFPGLRISNSPRRGRDECDPWETLI